MLEADENVDSEEEYEIKLVHCKQRNSWDCGLSCIMMILPKKQRGIFHTNFNEICKEEGFGKSTWTIDLCYLLKKFSVKFIFYTTFLGVNPEHKSQFFYEKILPQWQTSFCFKKKVFGRKVMNRITERDTERVMQRFNDAEKNGIDIKQSSIKTDELISHIKKNGPVILLTNASYLNCDICKRNNATSKLIEFLPKAVNYHGHYVVLCGYNLKKSQFYYRNPAYSNSKCSYIMFYFGPSLLSFNPIEKKGEIEEKTKMISQLL